MADDEIAPINEYPAFKIRREDGSWIVIWGDGRVEGISGLIINKIPLLLQAAYQNGYEAGSVRY